MKEHNRVLHLLDFDVIHSKFRRAFKRNTAHFCKFHWVFHRLKRIHSEHIYDSLCRYRAKSAYKSAAQKFLYSVKFVWLIHPHFVRKKLLSVHRAHLKFAFNPYILTFAYGRKNADNGENTVLTSHIEDGISRVLACKYYGFYLTLQLHFYSAIVKIFLIFICF